jgi:hypothetical protein
MMVLGSCVHFDVLHFCFSRIHQIKSHNSATTEVKIIKKCTDPQTTIPNHLVKFEQYWSMQGKS